MTEYAPHIRRARRRTALVCCVLAGALGLRLYCALGLPAWLGPDAHEYEYIAQGLVQYLQGGRPEDPARMRELAANRGWLYPLFIAGVYRVAGIDPVHVRVVQAVVDTLSCLLVFVLARRLFGAGVALAALVAAAVYPGFPFFATFLCQETTTLFLLLLFCVLLTEGTVRKKLPLLFGAGVVLALVSLLRPAFQFSGIVFFPAFFFVARKLAGRYLRLQLPVVAGFLLVAAGWAGFAVSSGSPVLLFKSSVWNVYETMRHDGWPTDVFLVPVTDELRGILREEGLAEQPYGPYNSLPPQVYVTAVKRRIAADPIGYVSQLMKRWDRIWWYIDTYPGRWHSPRVWWMLLLQRLLVVLALIGVPLVVMRRLLSWIPLLIVLYGAGISLPIAGLPRYNIPLMPFVIVFAAAAGAYLLKGAARCVWSGVVLRPAVLTVAGVAALFVLRDVPLLGAAAPLVSACGLYRMGIFFGSAGMCLLSCAAFLLLRGGGVVGRKRAAAGCLLTCLVCSVLYLNEALQSRVWHEWQAPLAGSGRIVRQEILLRKPLVPQDIASAHILLDLFPHCSRSRGYRLQVACNGRVVKDFVDGLQDDPARFDKKFFGLYRHFFFDTYGLTPEDLRQWYFIAVPPAVLGGQERLTIDLMLTAAGEEADGVTVFGDFPHCGLSGTFEGPAVPLSDYDTSLTKIMPYSGDSRFDRSIALASAETRSSYFSGDSWQTVDLSSAGGVQSGSYRIRLQVITRGGRQIIF